MTEPLDRVTRGILEHIARVFRSGGVSVYWCDSVEVEGNTSEVRLTDAVLSALNEDDRVKSLAEKRKLESTGAIVRRIFNNEFRKQLRARFPWLETDDQTNGGDVVDGLSDFYNQLGSEEKEELDETNTNN